jgi:acyl-CoA hydrolase
MLHFQTRTSLEIHLEQINKTISASIYHEITNQIFNGVNRSLKSENA